MKQTVNKGHNVALTRGFLFCWPLRLGSVWPICTTISRYLHRYKLRLGLLPNQQAMCP